LKRNNVSKK